MSEQLAATRRGFAFVLCATALLGMASACGPKYVLLATITGDAAVGDAAVGDAAVGDAAVGDAGLHELCNGPIDCRPGTICVKSATACDAQGTCEPAVSCLNAPYSPVCGCNLATYVNDCQRINAGVGQT